MKGATGNIYLGLHEFADMMFVLHFLRPGQLFFDVGANVGTYTVLAAGVCRAHTWAFEPSERARRGLLRNIEVNHLTSLVRVLHAAVSDADGLAQLTMDSDTMNRIVTCRSEQTEVVHTVKLDTVAGSRCPNMMKIDVEGHEERVIRGAQHILTNDSLQVIELESVTVVTRAILSEHGFVEVFYDPFQRTVLDVPSPGFQSNKLFIRVRDLGAIMDRLRSAEPIVVLGRPI